MWFYHLLFPAVFVLGAPYFAWRMLKRGRAGHGLGERFGIYPVALRRKVEAMHAPLWIHAVSVGEMMLARVLVRELRRLRPGQEVVVTCTTSTGRAVAERTLEDERTAVLHTPVDALWIVRRAFRLVRPSVVVLLEQELWPAQMEEARRRGVPVWIVNARLSDRSWRRMKRWRGLLGRLCRPVAFVGLQQEADRTRMAEAGFPPHALFHTGSMKCDVAELDGDKADLADEVRRKLGWDASTPVVMAGSTHPGEEALLLEAFCGWKAKHPDLKLFLAPRHAERAGEVMRLAEAAGWTAVRRSAAAAGADVAVLDTTGELRSLYPLADVVVMGKTLIAPDGQGGQNFLEAARAGRAVVCGPRVENFRAQVEAYVRDGALVRLADASGLAVEVDRLLGDEAARGVMGSRARTLYQAELGAGARVAGMLASVLK